MSDLFDRLSAALSDTYRIESELGGGGMARVFLAEEIALKRQVVLKVLPPEMSATVNKERFQREIRLAASLQHPHIVPLLTAGAADDVLYYTMPYIQGETLRHRLERAGELPVSEAAQQRAVRQEVQIEQRLGRHLVHGLRFQPRWISDEPIMSVMEFESRPGVRTAVSRRSGRG